MPIVYYDKAILDQGNSYHPAAVIDENHPCYRMVREAVDGKSVFHWTKSQAYAMYKWYCEGWKSVKLEDEFGEDVPEYSFKEIIRKSHYMVSREGKKLVPSLETIQEMWDAVLMEKKILEANGDELKDS